MGHDEQAKASFMLSLLLYYDVVTFVYPRPLGKVFVCVIWRFDACCLERYPARRCGARVTGGL